MTKKEGPIHAGVMSAALPGPNHAAFHRVLRHVAGDHKHVIIVGHGGVPQDEKIAHLRSNDPEANYEPAHPDGVVEHIRQLAARHEHVHVHVEDDTPTEYGPRGGIRKRSTFKDFNTKKWPENVTIHKSPRLAGVSGSKFRAAADAGDHKAIGGMVDRINKAARRYPGKPVSKSWARISAAMQRKYGVVRESKSFAQLREELEQYK